MAAASPRCGFDVAAFFVLSVALVLTLLPLCMGRRPVPAHAGSIDAIYNFGDSVSDTGNELIEDPTALSGKPPYGETFGKPTGRWSDGLLMIDYLAKFLDLPYLPPYLDSSANFSSGVNFAVGGATALDRSFFVERGFTAMFTNSSLGVQLEWFKSHLSSICTSHEDCKMRLRIALFLVGGIGGNDYINGVWDNKTIHEMEAYVPNVIGAIVNAIKDLIDLGAIHLIVPGNFPIGCIPSTFAFPVNNHNYDKRGCIKDMNKFAQFHNEHLQDALNNLRKDHPDVTIRYADYYNAFLGLLDNYDNYGFDASSLFKACCGASGLNDKDLNHHCGIPGVAGCPDPSKFLSWDGLHLTQEAYEDMAIQLFSKDLFISQKVLLDI